MRQPQKWIAWLRPMRRSMGFSHYRRVSPQFHRWRAAVIRRRFKAGTSAESLTRQYGRLVVERALRAGVR